MSQHWLTGNTPNGSVEILIGWDEPLQWFHMTLEPDADEPLYSNLYEPNPHSLTLADFQKVLDRYGITNISLHPNHPDGLYELLEDDRQNQR